MPVPRIFEGDPEDLTVGNVNAVRSPSGRLRRKQKKAMASMTAGASATPTVESLRRQMGEDTIGFQHRLFKDHGIDLRGMPPLDQRRTLGKLRAERLTAENEAKLAEKKQAHNLDLANLGLTFSQIGRNKKKLKKTFDSIERQRLGPWAPLLREGQSWPNGPEERTSNAKSAEQRLFEKEMRRAHNLAGLNPRQLERFNRLERRGIFSHRGVAADGSPAMMPTPPINVPTGVDLGSMQDQLVDGQVYRVPEGDQVHEVMWDAREGAFTDPKPPATYEEQVQYQREQQLQAESLVPLDLKNYSPDMAKQIIQIRQKFNENLRHLGRSDERAKLAAQTNQLLESLPTDPTANVPLKDQINAAIDEDEYGRSRYFDASGVPKWEDNPDHVSPTDIMRQAAEIAKNADEVWLKNRIDDPKSKMTQAEAREMAFRSYLDLMEKLRKEQLLLPKANPDPGADGADGADGGDEAGLEQQDGVNTFWSPKMGKLYRRVDLLQTIRNNPGVTVEQLYQDLGIEAPPLNDTVNATGQMTLDKIGGILKDLEQQ